MFSRRTFLLASATAPLRGPGKFTPLFDGRSLDGWDGDPRLWSVQQGTIVGSTERTKIAANSFLVTRRRHRDFVLRLQARLRNNNSGIQFRSQLIGPWALRGYQADMGQDNYWGNLYEEKGTRGTLVDGWAAGGKTAARLGDWNDFEIRCQGPALQVTLNGTVTARLKDSQWAEGLIGLQLHTGDPMVVSFRRIELQTLA